MTIATPASNAYHDYLVYLDRFLVSDNLARARHAALAHTLRTHTSADVDAPGVVAAALRLFLNSRVSRPGETWDVSSTRAMGEVLESFATHSIR